MRFKDEQGRPVDENGNLLPPYRPLGPGPIATKNTDAQKADAEYRAQYEEWDRQRGQQRQQRNDSNNNERPVIVEPPTNLEARAEFMNVLVEIRDLLRQLVAKTV